MRYLNQHLCAEGNQPVSIVAVDTPAPGEAQCRYDVMGFNTVYNPSASTPNGQPAHFTRLPVIFRTNEDALDFSMPNGVSVESMIAICADHLYSKQGTPAACEEYQVAFENLYQALQALTKRRQRIRAEQGEFLESTRGQALTHRAA